MKKFKYFFKKILPATLFLTPFFGFALTIANPLSSPNLETLANNLINFILSIIGLIALAVIIYSGFLFMTSGGNPDQVEKAKKTLTYAVAGLGVVILASAIVNFILQAFR